MSRIIASKLIQIRHYLHEAEMAFLVQDARHLADQLKMVATVASALSYDILNTKNDPFSTPESQAAQSCNNFGGNYNRFGQWMGQCQAPGTTASQPTTPPVTSNPKTPSVHTGFSAFNKQKTNSSNDSEWKPVVSSNIKAIRYSQDNETLFVKFINDEIYQFADVPPAVYSSFLVAPSKGMFFYNNIRDAYDSVRCSG